MLVAIHQPNFFPWCGYFDKIKQADIFIFLDNVDYPRSGSSGMGSWVNRVKLSIQDQPKWVTCPIQRMPLGTLISEVKIDENQHWRKKLLNTLKMNYAKSINYKNDMPFLEDLINIQEPLLAKYNIAVIKEISKRLKLTTNFVSQSELNYSGHSTALLMSLVKAVGGTAYLTGGGSAAYQDDSVFEGNNIEVIYQNYIEQSYCNDIEFLPGLSIIDYMFKNTKKIIS